MRRSTSWKSAVPRTEFRREQLPYEAAFLAGKAFLHYQRRGGAANGGRCPISTSSAHAAVSDFRLLTRDPRRYRAYFPTVKLIAP